MDQVEEIKSKVDIVALVSEHVQLTKAGRNYKGLCPFHQERTPSFNVSPELGIFKCFGCQKSGDCISFLEEIEGIEFYDALKLLANKTGVKLVAPQGEMHFEKEKLIEANELAAKFYHYLLLNHPSGKVGLEYVTNKRKINLETIEKFNLGLAPDISDVLAKFLISKKGFKVDQLEKAGLVVRGRNRNFDRFRGRIIFPLFDHRNVCVGLAGRILPAIEAALPKNKHVGKYVNGPETLIYHKSKILYGLNITKFDIKKENLALVVEGEVDFLSVWQAGIKNIVAIKGTALTEEQIKILSRFCETLVLALDSDIAGDAAMRRGITIAQAQGLKVKVLRPSKQYKDPDEFVRGDFEGFKAALQEAESIWDFLIDSTFEKYSSGSGEDKASVSRELVPILNSIEDKIVQSHYVSLVAKRLAVPVEAVTSQISKVNTGKNTNSGFIPKEIKQEEKQETGITFSKENTNKSRQQLLEERLLSLVFQKDPQVLITNKALFVSPFVLKIMEKLEEYYASSSKFDLKQFGEQLPSELKIGFSELLLQGTIEVDEEDVVLDKEIERLINNLKLESLKAKQEDLKQQLMQAESKEDEAAITKLTEEFDKISEQRKKLIN